MDTYKFFVLVNLSGENGDMKNVGFFLYFGLNRYPSILKNSSKSDGDDDL